MVWKKRGQSVIYATKKYRTDRAELVKAFRPGQPCVLCGHPILTVRYVEAQHVPGTDKLLGLVHGTRNPCHICRLRCNQTDGAKRGRARQNKGTSGLRW